MRVLAIKRRSWRKGLILIGADLAQLERYVVLPAEPRRSQVLATWPGPHTWVLDARADAPRWITGGRRASPSALRLTPSRRALPRRRRGARLDERQREPAPAASAAAAVAARPRPPSRLCPAGAARRPGATHGHQGRPQRPCPPTLSGRWPALSPSRGCANVSAPCCKRPN